jgi:hypothetical protein
MISISLAAVARASHSREGGRQDLFQISVATRPVVGRPRGGPDSVKHMMPRERCAVGFHVCQSLCVPKTLSELMT